MFTVGVAVALYGVYLMSEEDAELEAQKMHILEEEEKSTPKIELNNGTVRYRYGYRKLFSS